MPLLLMVYLVGAICTAWCLRISTMGRELPFFSISSVIWPRALVRQAGGKNGNSRDAYTASDLDQNAAKAHHGKLSSD